jgi:hypothetical protein
MNPLITKIVQDAAFKHSKSLGVIHAKTHFKSTFSESLLAFTLSAVCFRYIIGTMR